MLNVGGSRFTTTITTLRNAPSPSLFAAMFSGRHKLKQDADSSIFIDRDGRHFADVLNYLRDGQVRAWEGGKGVAVAGLVARAGWQHVCDWDRCYFADMLNYLRDGQARLWAGGVG